MVSQTPPKILIIGASISGPVLASFLLLSSESASDTPEITLLERASKVRPEGQNVDIRGVGFPIIDKLQIEDAIRAATTGEVGAEWVDHNGITCASFPAGKNAGTAEVEILRGDLAHITVDKCRELSKMIQSEGGAGVEFIFGDYLESIDQVGDKVKVVFTKSKQDREYDLVIGADGLQSSTRRIVWGREGDDQRVKRLGMYGGFYSLPKRPHDNMWRKWFHAPGRKSIMVRPDKQRDRTTVFMSVINEKDPRFYDVAVNRRDDVSGTKKLLAEYFKGAGWESDELVEAMMKSDDFYYDMVAQVKLDKWSKGRVVLVGDAAYCASPISGMGTTLGLSGAYNLAGALKEHPDDYEAAFAAYEVEMRPLVTKAQKLPPGAPNVFNPETAWGVWLLSRAIGVFGWIIKTLKLVDLIFLFIGPPSESIKLKEYGFRSLKTKNV